VDYLRPEIVATLGGVLMVVAIVFIVSMGKVREKELLTHEDLRAREMEHERRLKELEVEKASIELERMKLGKSA